MDGFCPGMWLNRAFWVDVKMAISALHAGGIHIVIHPKKRMK
jgi:hypothetical protein